MDVEQQEIERDLLTCGKNKKKKIEVFRENARD